jgi:hypothetical protein
MRFLARRVAALYRVCTPRTANMSMGVEHCTVGTLEVRYRDIVDLRITGFSDIGNLSRTDRAFRDLIADTNVVGIHFTSS